MSTAKSYTREELETLPLSKLAEIHNDLGEARGVVPVKKFSDKESAVRRVLKLVEAAPAPKVAKKERKKRSMYFTFPIKDTIGEVRDPESLRYKLLQRLRREPAVDGELLPAAKFEDLVEVTKAWDKKNNAGNSPQEIAARENVVRRAYEGTRLLHYYVGYGMRQNADETITLIEKK